LLVSLGFDPAARLASPPNAKEPSPGFDCSGVLPNPTGPAPGFDGKADPPSPNKLLLGFSVPRNGAPLLGVAEAAAVDSRVDDVGTFMDFRKSTTPALFGKTARVPCVNAVGITEGFS
jgi:hypothetical protein